MISDNVEEIYNLLQASEAAVLRVSHKIHYTLSANKICCSINNFEVTTEVNCRRVVMKCVTNCVSKSTNMQIT